MTLSCHTKEPKLDWLGEIPQQWRLEKLKFNSLVQFSNVNKKSEEGEQAVRLCNYVDVYYNDSITSEIDFMEATASKKEIDKFKLKIGDVIVTKDSEEWSDIAIPSYVACEFPDLICGYHLAQIRPNINRIAGKFLFYLLSSHRINHQFKIEATGITRYGLGNYALNNALISIPSLGEQKIIVDYLDNKTEKIDALVLKKERMIDLLKEERAAVINNAVTRGLDPKVELQDTGIEWLGKVPKHWKIKKLKYVGEAIIGLTYSPDEVSPEGTLVLRSSNIQGGNIVFDDNVYVNKEIPSKLVVKREDILVCSRNGSRALIGKCALLDERCEGQSFGVFMTIFRSRFNRFVYHIFNSTIFQFHIGSFLTATINQLTTGNLNGIIALLV